MPLKDNGLIEKLRDATTTLFGLLIGEMPSRGHTEKDGAQPPFLS